MLESFLRLLHENETYCDVYKLRYGLRFTRSQCQENHVTQAWHVDIGCNLQRTTSNFSERFFSPFLRTSLSTYQYRPQNDPTLVSLAFFLDLDTPCLVLRSSLFALANASYLYDSQQSLRDSTTGHKRWRVLIYSGREKIIDS